MASDDKGLSNSPPALCIPPNARPLSAGFAFQKFVVELAAVVARDAVAAVSAVQTGGDRLEPREASWKLLRLRGKEGHDFDHLANGGASRAAAGFAWTARLPSVCADTALCDLRVPLCASGLRALRGRG